MKKNKTILVILSVVLMATIVTILISKNANNKTNKVSSLESVKKSFQSDIQDLKEGKYDNLVYNDFEASIDNIEGIYNLEILTDNSYRNRTFLENFELMNESIDKFFMEDFDKSCIDAVFNIEGGERISVGYDDIEKVCTDDKYNGVKTAWLFCNETANGGFMVQIGENLGIAWFSRGEIMGDILPSEYKKAYPYVTGIRQVDDVKLNLKDGEIMLSEMENKVLDFVNNKFPLPISDGISMGIAGVRILNNGDYDGVCFKVRRIYKGIPFENGSNLASGMFIDQVDSDDGEVDYAVSSYPDTMLSFGVVNGTVVETDIIEEIISLGDALNILSDKIGENSVYDVYGVELIYRNSKIPDERYYELDDILTPKWKIITINQNDSKYTLFYVDVVTGEITQRFEYYYE